MWTASFRKSTVVGWTTILVLWLVVVAVDGGITPMYATFKPPEVKQIKKKFDSFKNASQLVTSKHGLDSVHTQALNDLESGNGVNQCAIITTEDNQGSSKLQVFVGDRFENKMKIDASGTITAVSPPNGISDFFGKVKLELRPGVDVSPYSKARLVCEAPGATKKKKVFFEREIASDDINDRAAVVNLLGKTTYNLVEVKKGEPNAPSDKTYTMVKKTLDQTISRHMPKKKKKCVCAAQSFLYNEATRQSVYTVPAYYVASGSKCPTGLGLEINTEVNPMPKDGREILEEEDLDDFLYPKDAGEFAVTQFENEITAHDAFLCSGWKKMKMMHGEGGTVAKRVSIRM